MSIIEARTGIGLTETDLTPQQLEGLRTCLEEWYAEIYCKGGRINPRSFFPFPIFVFFALSHLATCEVQDDDGNPLLNPLAVRSGETRLDHQRRLGWIIHAMFPGPTQEMPEKATEPPQIAQQMLTLEEVLELASQFWWRIGLEMGNRR